MNKINKNSAPREMIRELQNLGDSMNSSLETRNLLQDIINRYNGQDLEDKYQAQYQEAQAKYQEAKALADKYLEAREARKAREAYKAREDKYREAREEAKAQLNAKLARELTLARIDALFHWEDCFLTGVVDDEHRVFIAEVLAREAKALQEENDNG